MRCRAVSAGIHIPPDEKEKKLTETKARIEKLQKEYEPYLLAKPFPTPANSIRLNKEHLVNYATPSGNPSSHRRKAEKLKCSHCWFSKFYYLWRLQSALVYKYTLVHIFIDLMALCNDILIKFISFYITIMIVLLDLDGTLTDTAHEKFKPYKDGLKDFDINEIPLFSNAVGFVQELERQGHFPVIISDSHPRYVKKIATEIFHLNTEESYNSEELTRALWLADKPNIQKTYDFLRKIAEEVDPHLPMIHLPNDKDEFIMVGDSWLDIELGRRLNIKTVLTQFYKATSIENRDGIGQDRKPIKMGPTYYAKNFDELLNIIQHPIENLLAIEAVFQNAISSKVVRFLHRRYVDGFAAFRCLARQEDGECDRFARADKYYQIDNPNRTEDFLKSIAKAATCYLTEIASHQNYQWHYFTYVSDKKTTNPPNKMKEIFDLVQSPFPKITLFKWNDAVTESLRTKPNYKVRRAFIANNLGIINNCNLQDKNIIVLDDQLTSSATANEICRQLRSKGVKKILFIALFYLISPISSKNCPRCKNPLKIKIRRSDGNRFYSCLPPQFGGQGCGYTENII